MAEKNPAPFTMPHLQNLQAEAAASLDAHNNPSAGPDTAEAMADPKAEKVYAFDIAYEDTGPSKRVYRGRFTNKILTIGERISVGVMRARLQMGVPVDALANDTYNLLFMVTWLQQSLTTKPDWAQDLLAQESEGLVKAIFDKVDEHEVYFRGPAPGFAPG